MTVMFDPVCYKDTTRTQWEEAAAAWHAWAPTLEDWLGQATTLMLDAAGIHTGSTVLDVAAGAGQYRALRPGGRISAIVLSTADRNGFFSIPVSIIRRRAQLAPPAPGQPGPFSLGGPGVLEDLFGQVGFRQVGSQVVPAPLRMPHAADCVRFQRESFGALHQMLAGLAPAQREQAWQEISTELARFERPEGFEGPCELIVAWGVK